MQTLISLPIKPKMIKQEGNLGVFEILNLYPGYGITLGNALRRVILNSIPGSAITSIKIKGANHEFSTINGVLEDVIEIILNIKQIRVKLIGDEPQKIYLKAKGVGEIKADQIEMPSQVEILNKDQHIASLTDKKAELEIEMLVEKGLGYEPAERRHKEKLEVGMIALDAIFTPIRKVNFESENMIVGDRADFNRLLINIETDGSLIPLDALNKGIEILVNQFGQLLPESAEKIIDSEKLIEKEEKKIKKEISEDLVGKKKIKTSLGDEAIEQSVRILGLSSRLTNALLEAKIKTVSKLLKKKEKMLLEISGIGEKGVEEIKEKLSELKLTLK